MKIQTNFCQSLLVTASLALLAGPALAQQADCAPMAPWERFQEQRAERKQQHQKRLHDALKLSPEQEDGWNKFVASMQPPARGEPPVAVDWNRLTAPERAEKMLELAKRRQERLGEHVAALKSFYATLTPEQQKSFDEHHPGRREGRGSKGPRRPESPAASRG